MTARAVLVAALGRLLFHACRYREAEDALAEASDARSGLSLLDRARLANNLGAVRNSSGSRAGAVAAWETALTLFERLDARIEVVRAQVNLCVGYKELGRWQRALEAGESAYAVATRQGEQHLACLAAANLAGLALARKHWGDAEQWIGRAEALAFAHELNAELCEVARLKAQLAISTEEESGLALAEQAESLARTWDSTIDASLAAALVAVGLARKGALDEAEAAIQRAVLPLQLVGATSELAHARLWTAQALLLMGQIEAADKQVSRVRLYAREVEDVPLRIVADELHSRLAEALSSAESEVQLDRLVELAVSIGQETDQADLVQRIASAALTLVPGERCFVLLGQPPVVVASESAQGPIEGRPSTTVIEQCLRCRAPVTAMDMEERGDLRDQASILSMDLNSVLCVPMIHDEEIMGVIYVDSRSAGRNRLWETAQLMRALAALAALTIAKLRYFEAAVVQARRAARLSERRRSERELADMARQLEEKNAKLEALNKSLQRAVTTDPLTGIGNRRHMMREIEQAHSHTVASGGHYGLLMLDIDHFKRFNDRFGHQVGDRALVHVTRAVREQLRSADHVFRYGGEELVVLAGNTTEADLVGLGWRLCRAVRESPLALDRSATARVTVSVGAAWYDPGQGVSWDDVLRRADHALYTAKAQGRDRVVTWTPDLEMGELTSDAA